MNKKKYIQLALMGIASGLVVPQVNADEGVPHTLLAKSCASCKAVAIGDGLKKADSTVTADDDYSDLKDGNTGIQTVSEAELLSQLNDEGKANYNSLSPEGKELARQVASQKCNAQNTCKGLNSCKTDKNSCAGKGSCKGQSKCSFTDKNLAVKLVSQKMAQQRSDALNK